MKTVIHAWTQSAVNLPRSDRANFWGLGDLLRGAAALSEFCRSAGHRYVLDMRGHPLGTAFATPEAEDCIDGIDYAAVRFETFANAEDLASTLTSRLRDQDRIVLNTNGYRDWPAALSDDTKRRLRQRLRPSAAVAAPLEATAPPAGSYDVLHCRLGDCAMTHGETGNVARALATIAPHCTPDTLLLSDDARFKEIAARLLHVRTTQAIPAHTGLASAEQLLDTVFEFLLVSRARAIKAYSVYSWTSGFVAAAAATHDVPLARIARQRAPSYWIRYAAARYRLSRL